jgi:hypothetical protein
MAVPKARPAAPEAAPRFAMGWAALTYALCALSLGYPAVAGGFLVNPRSDQYLAGFAFREFAAESLKRTGGFPQWNPYLFGGMPYVAAMHGDIFYPTFLLRLLMPTDVAMTWAFILHVFLAGLFTYGFLRASGIGFWGSLIGGVGYMIGGNVAGLVSPGHDGKLYLAALLPLTLWILHLGLVDGRRWTWGALAIVVGLGVLTPHPQVLQYLLLLAGAYALYLSFLRGDENPLARSVTLRRLGLALVAIAVGALIGAIQYLPVREYVAWSPRAGGKGWEHAVSFSLPPEEIFNFYLPQFTGLLEHYWGRNNFHFHSDYVGASVVGLAGLAFGSFTTSVRKRFVLFWTGALIVSTLWAMGGYTPFYHLVYAVVPGTKYFRAPSSMLYIVQFCIVVLAAVGIERALAGAAPRKYLIAWVVGATLVAVLASAGGLTNLATSIAGPERNDFVRDNSAAVVTGAWRSFVVIVFAVGAILLGAANRLSLRAAGIALTVIVAADLWSILRLYWKFSPRASVIYASDPTIDYLRKLPQPARVITFPDSRTLAYHDPTLVGTGLMSHAVRQATGYHGNELGRYDEMLGDGYRNLGNPNFWRLYNIQYLLANADSLGIPDTPKVAGPTTDAAGTPNVSLFKLPVDAPFAWVAPVIVKAGDTPAMNTVLDPRFDVTRAAIFDSTAAVQAETISALPEALALPVQTTRYEPGRISLELAKPAPKGSALVVSENYYPGWSAKVDGASATVGRADVTLIGVPLPAGATKVDLVFESVTYERGKWLTMIALIVSTSLLLGGLALDWRRRA